MTEMKSSTSEAVGRPSRRAPSRRPARACARASPPRAGSLRAPLVPPRSSPRRSVPAGAGDTGTGYRGAERAGLSPPAGWTAAACAGVRGPRRRLGRGRVVEPNDPQVALRVGRRRALRPGRRPAAAGRCPPPGPGGGVEDARRRRSVHEVRRARRPAWRRPARVVALGPQHQRHRRRARAARRARARRPRRGTARSRRSRRSRRARRASSRPRRCRVRVGHTPVLAGVAAHGRASQLGAVEQRAELVVGQVAQLAGSRPASSTGPIGGAGQPAHGVADVVEQPAHDPVAALVDDQLDDRLAAARRAWPR